MQIGQKVWLTKTRFFEARVGDWERKIFMHIYVAVQVFVCESVLECVFLCVRAYYVCEYLCIWIAIYMCVSVGVGIGIREVKIFGHDISNITKKRKPRPNHLISLGAVVGFPGGSVVKNLPAFDL